MMKWLARIFFVIAVLMIGYSVLQSSMLDRSKKYYEKEAVPLLVDGDIDGFVRETMTVSQASRYLTKPILRYESNDSTYSFKINIYHFEATVNKTAHYGFIMYMYDFEVNGLEDILEDYSAYENDPSLLNVNIQFNGKDAQNIYFSTNIGFTFNGKNIKGSSFSPIFIMSEGEDEYFLEYVEDAIKMSAIANIQFYIVDGTNDNKKAANPFAEIIASDDVTDLSNETHQFELKGKTLSTDKFNGDIDFYKNFNTYYDGSNIDFPIAEIDITKLSKYNNVVTKAMIIYGVVAILSGFLLFFLRPIIEQIQKNKAAKKQSEK